MIAAASSSHSHHRLVAVTPLLWVGALAGASLEAPLGVCPSPDGVAAWLSGASPEGAPLVLWLSLWPPLGASSGVCPEEEAALGFAVDVWPPP